MTKVVLVDAGGSNIGSVRYALQRLGVDAELTGDAATIRAADRVILPGVGAAAVCMARLRELDLVDVLRTLDKPLLGVCVGVQLLFAHSEEDDTPCLGLLPGRVRKLHAAPGIRVPHMGWNTLQRRRAGSLVEGIADGDHAYFVHSYAAAVDEDCLCSSEHGQRFAAVVQRGNVAGAQFHPERSGAVGARLLKNFIEYGLQ
ncbi:MAG: imidazole glycerol phosphate synthase subunit HisH [Pseudoxanthomonas sp.]|uniref:imidazole glycerol phosphate synthase subunit HisH n=1 Tax=Pseudoxanthomonas TaxID=83618 RepID=UPI001389D21D|nr:MULTISPECIES: imidazole glycerol phosphate synthase subunit HisH [Pseudoxanthomonas]KAF1727878.1 imidazole glycerol phosphate synthase subunit HisH [Pseudoxanthomonas mexicana]MCH2092049.1 imidazole glycerol phosphate synthase subunit HisH [Pseudoxanthomonas sp.]